MAETVKVKKGGIARRVQKKEVSLWVKRGYEAVKEKMAEAPKKEPKADK